MDTKQFISNSWKYLAICLLFPLFSCSSDEPAPLDTRFDHELNAHLPDYGTPHDIASENLFYFPSYLDGRPFHQYDIFPVGSQDGKSLCDIAFYEVPASGGDYTVYTDRFLFGVSVTAEDYARKAMTGVYVYEDAPERFALIGDRPDEDASSYLFASAKDAVPVYKSFSEEFTQNDKDLYGELLMPLTEVETEIDKFSYRIPKNTTGRLRLYVVQGYKYQFNVPNGDLDDRVFGVMFLQYP